LKVAILTVSDRCSRNEMKDQNVETIKEMISGIGEVVAYEVVPDERELISRQLIFFCDDMKVDLVLTAGGTGFAPRDVTPEATKEIIEKEVPGIPEMMRVSTFFSKTHNSILSRATAGIRKSTLIVNLPGNPNGVREDLEVIMDILPLGISVLGGKPHNHAKLGDGTHDGT
jgi:molybdopterin adenylyltransferase